MYTIGEFSSIINIPKKTLRYYDEINLLKPSSINPENGYRMYNKDQAFLCSKIKKYKSFGMSLSEIKHLVNTIDEKDILRLLDDRLDNINDEMHILAKQKQMIKEYRRNKNKNAKVNTSYEISKKVFDEGSIFSIKKLFEKSDIHELINEYYHTASRMNIKLLSGHYIRKVIGNHTDEEMIEIFAYAQGDDSDKLSQMCKTETLLISCQNMECKSHACMQLIDYAKSNGFEIDGFIEEYTLSKGKLGVEIYGVLA